MASTPPSSLGPYKPTLILHGGAGAISRTNLPPELYSRYHASLLQYLTATQTLLDNGASALDAACHAVSRLEDDPLFNCGRGAVFTEAGTIEMEASVMVCSIDPAGPPQGRYKRGAAVSLIRNTRHPIFLAKEVLVSVDDDGGFVGTSSMHCHLSGHSVEEWGWRERSLERKPDAWFWTQRRWDEHRKGLEQSRPDLLAKKNASEFAAENGSTPRGDDEAQVREGKELELPSQGTVGAVCMDSWGNLAVATSTGGLTNKKAGRIGDTPTIGAGFWAESWDEVSSRKEGPPSSTDPLEPDQTEAKTWHTRAAKVLDDGVATSPGGVHRRAVAMSGTGNGDSFLRLNAARTVASLCRFSSSTTSPSSWIPLSTAVTAITGPGGELQKSAGDRWLKTGEGEGGIIGIEIDEANNVNQPRNDVVRKGKRGNVVFDFNCGGLWRAYYELDPDTGRDIPRIMVFKDEY